MLSAFYHAFRTPDLRRKILFTLSILAVFRLGSVVPAPGVDATAVQQCLTQVQGNQLYSLINLFSGGALLQLAIFALGIMPYITASIIIQLLTVVIPRLEALKKEGQAGQPKITQYTRYLTIGLAILQSTTIVALARTPGRLIQGCDAAAAARHLGRHHPRDGHHDDGGHCGHHVARRAHHRARCRQRDVAADLHADRGGVPERAVADPPHERLGRLRDHPGHRFRGGRGGGVRRTGATPHPGPVRQAHGRPTVVRRDVDLHPAEGEPGWRHPGHLRLVAALPACAHRAVLREPRPAGSSGSRPRSRPGPARSTCSRTRHSSSSSRTST